MIHVVFSSNLCVYLQKRQPDFDFIDPLAPKKARISHLSNRGAVASSSSSSSDRREDEGSPSSKRSSLPSNVASGPPTHLPISSHPPAPSHQQPSPASNSNSPSTPEGCGTQDLPMDQSSSCRDPSPSPFASDRNPQDRYRHPVPVPIPRPAASPSPPPPPPLLPPPPPPPPVTSLTVTSTVITSPPLPSSTNKKYKKKSKKHKDKDREREKGKRTESGSRSPPNMAEQAEETRRVKKRRGAEEASREVIDKNPHKAKGLFLSNLLSALLINHVLKLDWPYQSFHGTHTHTHTLQVTIRCSALHSLHLKHHFFSQLLNHYVLIQWRDRLYRSINFYYIVISAGD